MNPLPTRQRPPVMLKPGRYGYNTVITPDRVTRAQLSRQLAGGDPLLTERIASLPLFEVALAGVEGLEGFEWPSRRGAK